MDLGDCIRDVLSFGASKHNLLASCLHAYCTVELDIENETSFENSKLTPPER